MISIICTHALIKFGDLRKICQTTKFRTSPKFPTIRYVIIIMHMYMHLHHNDNFTKINYLIILYRLPEKSFVLVAVIRYSSFLFVKTKILSSIVTQAERN